MSVRANALTVLKTRLERILIANGFSTDAGQKVFIGETVILGPDDLTATISMVIRADIVTFKGEQVVVKLPVDVVGVVRNANVDAPWFTLEAVIADIKTAVETDHNLGGTIIRNGLERGSTEPLDRDGGSEFVGATVQYTLLFAETWGSP